jgi:hypothetical protein
MEKQIEVQVSVCPTGETVPFIVAYTVTEHGINMAETIMEINGNILPDPRHLNVGITLHLFKVKKIGRERSRLIVSIEDFDAKKHPYNVGNLQVINAIMGEIEKSDPELKSWKKKMKHIEDRRMAALLPLSLHSK